MFFPQNFLIRLFSCHLVHQRVYTFKVIFESSELDKKMTHLSFESQQKKNVKIRAASVTCTKWQLVLLMSELPAASKILCFFFRLHSLPPCCYFLSSFPKHLSLHQTSWHCYRLIFSFYRFDTVTFNNAHFKRKYRHQWTSLGQQWSTTRMFSQFLLAFLKL